MRRAGVVRVAAARFSSQAKRRAKQPAVRVQPEKPDPEWLLAAKIAAGLAVAAASLRMAGPGVAKAAITVPLLLPRTVVALGPSFASAAVYILLRRRLGWSVRTAIAATGTPWVVASSLYLKASHDATLSRSLLDQALGNIFAAQGGTGRLPTVEFADTVHSSPVFPNEKWSVTARVRDFHYRHERHGGLLTVVAERSAEGPIGAWGVTSACVTLDNYPDVRLDMHAPQQQHSRTARRTSRT